MRLLKFFAAVFFLIAALWIYLYGTFIYGRSVKESRHNLSSGGLGELKAGDTSMVCIFCHTTHLGTAAAPLWNREQGAPVYTLYESSTMKSIPGQPDGASKLCLSCHDGTIALGKVIKSGRGFDDLSPGLGRIPPGRRSNLGSDLSDDHPISFDSAAAVGSNPELKHPPLNDRVKYDKNGKVQCTSCHDPHNDIFGDFLVKDNRGAAICKCCHQLTGFSGISTHDISTNTWDGTQQTPWPHTDYPTVAGNSCMNCHYSHAAQGKHRLLSAGLEEEVCLVCHNGSVAVDIETAHRKRSGHRENFYQGIHDPVENILTASRHVECVDCHNPHRVRGTQTSAPNINGHMEGVSGMTITGNIINQAQYQYQVCLKCHGQDKYRVSTPVNRMYSQTNLRLAFNPANTSYHPVVTQGTSRYVPSLKPPYTTSSWLYCTDCHNSSDTGAKGPHGSRWDYLLEERYEISNYTNWSEAYYALCFKCHDPNLLLNPGVSGFEFHDKHIRDESTPCSVCHDPHGSTNYIALLNFDTNVVFPNMNGEMKFEVIGNTGYCYMQCHGKEHSPKEYKRK
jgi:predicted CXXCH cytochrome family protein